MIIGTCSGTCLKFKAVININIQLQMMTFMNIIIMCSLCKAVLSKIE